MPRRNQFYAQVGEGRTCTVGYSPTVRGGILGVRFLGPDGKRLERMTRCRKKDANYHLEAARLIAQAYAPTLPDSQAVTWDNALAEVEKTSPDLRPATVLAYRKAIKALRKTFAADEKLAKQPTGPVDITDELAPRFARLFLSGTFKRGKASNAKTYKRSPVTLAFYLRGLSGLWAHFRELGFTKSNPWAVVRKPQTERKRKEVPTENDVSRFVEWVKGRYPAWERLHALIELKAVSGCRTLDLVQLRSNQLRDYRVVWDADQMKTKEGRSVLLPEDLFNSLRNLAGRMYLWENIPDDIKKHRPSKNRLPETFDPMTVYWLINNLFREYAEAHPDRPRLSPHAFRRRAITLTVLATGNVDATAQAIGINPQTARAYYLDAQRAFNADDVFKKVAAVLIPGTADKSA